MFLSQDTKQANKLFYDFLSSLNVLLRIQSNSLETTHVTEIESCSKLL